MCYFNNVSLYLKKRYINSKTNLLFSRFLSGKVSAVEIRFYRDQLKELLSTADEESFDNLQEKLSKRWSAEFQRYFSSNIVRPMRERAATFALNRMGFPSANNGITINASESLNNILKAAQERKEVEVDVLILVLYHFQTFYSEEYKRAIGGEGEWVILKEFEGLHDVEELSTNNLQMDLQEMKSAIRGALQLNPIRPSQPKPRLASTIMAERAIFQNQVSKAGNNAIISF